MTQTLAVPRPPAGISIQTPAATADDVAMALQPEVTLPSDSPEGRPLPFLSHWTTGIHAASRGWSPDRQMGLIAQGHYLLPWFEFPERGGDGTRDYYSDAMAQARNHTLPITLVGSQWERSLSAEPYLSLPAEANPNVVTVTGEVLPKVSPFGPVEPWRELGRRLVDNAGLHQLQEWYPEPPKVIFLSNNEHAKLRWTEVESDVRYLKQYGSGRPAEFKRAIVANGWIERYRALMEGMREGLVADKWRSNAVFVGYNAFGPPHFGRWGAWANYSLHIPGRIDPNALMWQGASAGFYTPNSSPETDFKVWSPQIEAMNQVFQQREAYGINPDFWFELSVWDGYEPAEPVNDKRKYYASLGQNFTPERYAGTAQFGMWLLRPRVVREYRGWTQPWEDGAPYFLALAEAVDSVHTNPVLREWWRHGELVANRTRNHPYQSAVPPEYASEDRWFLLDGDVNPSHPWTLSEEIAVYALALVQGEPPTRQWLVYAHSPLGDRRGVGLTVPAYGNIQVDVAVGGSFYVVSEHGRSIEHVR